MDDLGGHIKEELATTTGQHGFSKNKSLLTDARFSLNIVSNLVDLLLLTSSAKWKEVKLEAEAVRRVNLT